MSPKNPERERTDELLLKLSALLDGELSADDEAAVFDAMSQNPALLAAFEAMSAARLPASDLAHASLSVAESDDLVAAVMAETAPAQVPESDAGALALAHRFVDDDLDGAGRTHLFALLDEKPALASPVAGFVASAEAASVAARAVADVAGIAESLRHVADHVDAQVAARERAWVLASGDLDDALTPAEHAELEVALPNAADDVAAFVSVAHVAEYLRASAASSSFAPFAAKAGEAALHAIEAARLAEEREHAALAAKTSAPVAPAESWTVRLWRLFAPARAPVAFGVAAAMAFFVVSGPTLAPAPTSPAHDPARDRMARDEIVNALAPSLLALNDGKPAGDLPLLADNDADVEALDTDGSTAVFSTDASHITVIWVDPGTGT